MNQDDIYLLKEKLRAKQAQLHADLSAIEGQLSAIECVESLLAGSGGKPSPHQTGKGVKATSREDFTQEALPVRLGNQGVLALAPMQSVRRRRESVSSQVNDKIKAVFCRLINEQEEEFTSNDIKAEARMNRLILTSENVQRWIDCLENLEFLASQPSTNSPEIKIYTRLHRVEANMLT